VLARSLSLSVFRALALAGMLPLLLVARLLMLAPVALLACCLALVPSVVPWPLSLVMVLPVLAVTSASRLAPALVLPVARSCSLEAKARRLRAAR
jgi:hypothetical protein